MIIKCQNVYKKYKEIQALDGLDLSIKKGDIHGLLGPNGAGKSTLINIFASLINHDQGDISIMEQSIPSNFHKIKGKLGFVPQDLAIYEDLTAYENISFFASLYGLRGKERKDKVNKALEFVGLKDRQKSQVKTFSGGMKRRLNIACGICHEPEIIFFDEPTVGIDPQSRNHILESIVKLNKQGNTIIYTTHYMEEAQSICDKISIIDYGKIIAEGTVNKLVKLVTKHELLYVKIKGDNFNYNESKTFLEIDGVESVNLEEEGINITHNGNSELLENVISKVKACNKQVSTIESRIPNLEDVFLTLTGRTLRD
ncbi:MAG: ABC transporter ATP-binding protein [Clostridiales bacterium]|nr:ABC transporter ATP-binding protein [Clostridiales bacterium]